jgi:A/G-specific adenine glycosylase
MPHATLHAPAANAALRRALRRWYAGAARDLPWRRTRDPYRLWISEIMLQQTQVRTASPYYERFVSEFPTVGTLAAAPLDRVLKLWEGLGYYSRARNLHRAALTIVRDYGGRLPTTAEELQHLPGVGRYTAAAIASIAFGQRCAVVDGNVKRVLARLFAIDRPIDDPRVVAELWQRAQDLCPPRDPGAHNQAMMELGARICTPRRPRCDACPLRRCCTAAAEGRHQELPLRRPNRAVPTVERVAAAIVRRGRLLLLQRPPTGLFGGLWELPGADLANGTAPNRALTAAARRLLGIRIAVGRLIGTVVHGLTHRLLCTHVFRCAARPGQIRPSHHVRMCWASPAQLEALALARLDRKVVGRVFTAVGDDRD